MDLGLTYKALASSEIDLIAGNSTDGLIDVAQPRRARRRPPLLPAVRRRGRAAQRHRQEVRRRVQRRWSRCANRLDDATMRRLNLSIDRDHRSPAEVAKELR